MKKTTILLVGALLCLNFMVRAQEPIKPLKVGDKLPQLKLAGLFNTTTDSVLISGNTRLMVLDFWSTWCGPCVQSLPYLHHIQKQYPKELAILLLNADAKPKLDEFIAAYKQQNEFSLPMLKYTVYVKALFAHYTIPHLVWINADGVIIAITDKEALNDANIATALQGNVLPIAQKDLYKPKPRKSATLTPSGS